MGAKYTVGTSPTPAQFIQAVEVVSRVLAAVVADADPDVRAVIRRRPEVQVAPPAGLSGLRGARADPPRS